IKVGARGVNGGRVAGGTGAKNDKAVMFCGVGHWLFEMCFGWKNWFIYESLLCRYAIKKACFFTRFDKTEIRP
ncbi:MAG: hypothetical protein ACNYPI_07940, partial [Arenicellales bacterium WSBS_2016_MAG_OTU3]